MNQSPSFPIPELFLRHLCVLYHENEETTVPVQAFISAAVRSGCRWMVLSDWMHLPEETAVHGKPRQGISGAVSDLFTPEELHSVDPMIERIQRMMEEAVADGFAGLRIVIDSSWLLDTPFPERHLFLYESRINELIERTSLHVLCMYRLSRFSTSFLPNILFLHPFLWQEGSCQINPHYLPLTWHSQRLSSRRLWQMLPHKDTPAPETGEPARLFDRVRQFAGGLSHELNNMLNVLSLGMDLLDSAEDFPVRLRPDLRDMHDARHRMDHLAVQLAAFSADVPVQLQRIVPSERLNEFVQMILDQVTPRLRVEFTCDEVVHAVMMDPAQFDQAILQIARNSAQACGFGGMLTVEIRNAQATADGRDGPPPGNYVQFVFTDSGPGISQSVLPHVFEPFFTTRPGQHGMGLPIVVGILKRHRGYIQISTSREAKTRVVLWLPTADAVPEDSTAPSAAAFPDRTIALVEDEPAILRLSERVLVREGYTVRSFASPRALFAELEREPFSIDLLLTDVVMPETNGFELFLRLRERWPLLPTVFMSGYTADVFTDDGNLPDRTRFLPKPFLPRALVECVRSALLMGDDPEKL
ncbi:MEDS domain-containing protein [Myxococcota bacterium]|nr:MEDS domain-containing protein [Myxococcota bacterium]